MWSRGNMLSTAFIQGNTELYATISCSSQYIAVLVWDNDCYTHIIQLHTTVVYDEERSKRNPNSTVVDRSNNSVLFLHVCYPQINAPFRSSEPFSVRKCTSSSWVLHDAHQHSYSGRGGCHGAAWITLWSSMTTVIFIWPQSWLGWHFYFFLQKSDAIRLLSQGRYVLHVHLTQIFV